MLVKYIPALCLAGYWSVVHGPDAVSVVMASHFSKRILEVLLLHDFSGSPTEEGYVCVVIGGFYAMVTWLFVRDGARARPQEVAAGAMLSLLGHQILKSPLYGDSI